MDLSKLTTADKVVGGSAIAFFIFMFLPWYAVPDFSEANLNGWDYWLTGIIPLLLAAVMVAQIALTRFSPSTKLPDLPLPWPQVHMIAGIAAAVLLLLRTVISSDVGAGGFDFDLERRIGLFLALLAAIGLAAGGFLKSKEGDSSSSPSAPPTPF